MTLFAIGMTIVFGGTAMLLFMLKHDDTDRWIP